MRAAPTQEMMHRDPIERSRLHVIVEIKPQHRNAIWRFFADRDYDFVQAQDLIGVPSKRNNCIFVPR